MANEKKSSDIIVWIIVGIVGLGYYYYETEKNPFDFRKEVPLAVAYGWERDDNLLGNDQYKLNVTIYHKALNPISGRVIVRAYGDVYGKGGEDAPNAHNYYFSDLVNAQPGRSGGFDASFYIKNPALQQDNLPNDFIKTHASMRFAVEFQPADSEKNWKTSSWNFEIRNGEINQQ